MVGQRGCKYIVGMLPTWIRHHLTAAGRISRPPGQVLGLLGPDLIDGLPEGYASGLAKQPFRSLVQIQHAVLAIQHEEGIRDARHHLISGDGTISRALSRWKLQARIGPVMASA